MLPPLRFEPRLKERLWGGRALADLYGKPLPPGVPVGESWEISDRPGDASVIRSGPLAGRDLRWLMEHHAAALLGNAAAPGGRFPLLVKILDAREILSVQVHPPAALAARLGGEPKTEMWYVTQSAPGATLSAGLKAGVTRDEFQRRLAEGTVDVCVHQVPVGPGDTLFLPSGRIHALGAGMVIFEIQQNSDTTYRVFDWNRVGPDGQARELHVGPALASIDFTDFEPGLVRTDWQTAGPVQTRRLVDDPLFTVEECRAQAATRLTWSADRPAVLGVVSGRLGIEHATTSTHFELAPGEFTLLPAAARPVALLPRPDTVWISASPGPVD
jgi:mannose-6-phosphate isomerase